MINNNNNEFKNHNNINNHNNNIDTINVINSNRENKKFDLFFNNLKIEINDNKEFLNVLDTLSKILQNVIDNEGNDKFYKINKVNKII
jgi:hypothetical protein